MDENRLTALAVLNEIEKEGAYSNLALNRIIEKAKPSSPAFVREVVYGVLENMYCLDYILSRLVNTPLKKNDIATKNILRCGIYQIAFMDSVPDYAVVDESVKAARKLCAGKDKFVNALLRRYLREKNQIALPDKNADLKEYLRTRYSYHPSIVKMWLDEFESEDTVESLLAAGNEKPELMIRANLLKTTVEALCENLEKEGFLCRRGRLVPEALEVKKTAGGQGKELTASDAFKEGLFYIQDESAMLAVEMLDPQPGELVMDVCAAPGGKTLFIGERMKNKGRILAFDIHEHKLKLLRQNARRQGVEIIATKTCDAAITDDAFKGKADRVLVDVPCSGLGVVRRRPEIKYKDYEKEFLNIPKLQGEILKAASRYVKPGGVIVYSTCTIADRENFGVVQEFLKENPSFKLKKEDVLQLFPHVHKTDGFCIIKMTN